MQKGDKVIHIHHPEYAPGVIISIKSGEAEVIWDVDDKTSWHSLANLREYVFRVPVAEQVGWYV